MPQHDDDIIPHQDEVEQVIEQEIGAKPRLHTFGDLFTPVAGFTGDPFGDFYIDGSSVWAAMEMYKTASGAFVVGTNLYLGDLDEAFGVPPTEWGSTNIPGRAVTPDGSVSTPGHFQIGTTGSISFVPYSAAGAVAGRIFQFTGRWPLADPDAAKAVVAAL